MCCMMYIDLCSTFREQRIALLQASFKMRREGPAVLHLLWTLKALAALRASPISVPSALVNHVVVFHDSP